MADKTNNVTIDIKAETAKATNEIKRLNAEMKKMSNSARKGNRDLKAQTRQLNQTTRSFASLTKHISQLAVIYGAFQGLQTTVRTFAEFEASVSRLGVISGATSSELKSLQAEAERLGETTIFSASQVADGMNSMAMAGLSAQESLDGIASVLDLSAIGLMSVEQSALIATTAMNGFSLEAQDIGRVSDVMAKTITTSATTVQELGNAYEKVGSVATAFGVSLETTSASLGVLADAGRRGSEAGTQLKIVMARLAGNKEASKYIKELGVEIYNAEGNILPFTEQIKNLKIELDKLSPEQRNLKIAEIFGTEALASANILINKIDEVESKIVSLENSYGFASRKAKDMMDNLTGDWKEFQSALEGLIITLGSGLSPALRDILDEATEFIQALDADEVEAFGEGIGVLVETMVDMVKAVLTITGSIKDLSDGISELTGVSGASQVKLLLLGVALSKLFVIAKGLDVAYKAMIVSNGALGGAMAVAGIKVTGFTKIIVKLKLGIRALFVLIRANPIGLFVTALVGLGIAITSVVSSNRELTKTIEDSGKQIENNGDVIGTTTEQLKAMDKAGREAFGDYVRGEIKKTEKALKGLEKALEDEADDLFVNKKAVKEMSKQHADLTITLEALKNKEQSLVKVNAKVIATEEEARRSALKTTKAKEKEIEVLDKLIKKREKELEQLIKNNAERVKSGEATLLKLYEKEQKLFVDLKKLEQELLDIRKDFASKRLAMNDSLDKRLAEARVAGLNNYEKYLDAQKRADELLSKAKEARTKGDLELARRYIDEYANLISQSAGTEIATTRTVYEYNKETKEKEKKDIEEIRVTRDQNLAKLKVNTELERGFRMKLITDERDAEISSHNIKINNKINELNLMKMSIQSQIEYLKNLAEIQRITSGIDVKLNFDSSVAQIDAINKSIDDLVTQKRQAKIDILADNEQAIGEIKTVDDLAKIPIEKDLLLNTDEAKKEGDELEAEEEKGEITKLVSMDLKQAEKDLEKLKKEAETDTSAEHIAELAKAFEAVGKLQALAGETTKSVHNLDTSKALRANNQMRNELSKPLPTLIQYIKQIIIPARQHGGLIFKTPKLPRFNDGGHLDSGVGHSRKTGKLSGYGGGDKVKALLEEGEFIIRKEAVRALGLARLHTINEGKLPRYQTGGYVPPIQKFNTGGAVQKPNGKSGKTVNLNLNVGGQTFNLISDEEVADSLARYLERSSF